MANLSVKVPSGDLKFTMHPIGTKFQKNAGIYVFTKRITHPDGKVTHTILYVGKTEDFSTRFDNHHKDAEIKAAQADHISVLIEAQDDVRSKYEEEICKKYQPTCNDQLK